jgi:hypothetical protein
MLHLQGPWKRKNPAEYGIVSQCMAPQRVNDQYLTNVLLKSNAKVRAIVMSVLYCTTSLSLCGYSASSCKLFVGIQGFGVIVLPNLFNFLFDVAAGWFEFITGS